MTLAESSATDRVAAMMSSQPFVVAMGVKLLSASKGAVDLELPFRADLTQQNGFFHGGIVGTLADISGGFAATSLATFDQNVLTVEYKINLMAPAVGEKLIGRGRVARGGRTLVVTNIEIFAVKGGVEKICATALQTLMILPAAQAA
ncbi:PaaI family thioesterase [Lacibacterium aquatile]|uniref:PaaI family thioesterase n=1 Tax=Lacibacterium aquatile TaxID=1168082 RepID=A0ABW5DQW9_9PROT